MMTKERQKKYRNKKRESGFEVISKWVPGRRAAMIRRIINIVCGTVENNHDCGLDCAVFDVSSMLNGESIIIKKERGEWITEAIAAKDE